MPCKLPDLADRFLHLFARGHGWKIDFESRTAAAFAGYMDGAVVLLNDSVNRAQTEATSLAYCLGREERLEKVLENLGVHADSRIADPESGILPFLQAAFDTSLRRIDKRRLDAELASVGHGVARIGSQVDQHLLQLIRIGLDRNTVLLRHGMKADVLAHNAP